MLTTPDGGVSSATGNAGFADSTGIDRNSARILYPLIAALLCLAWFNRFIQDDAFISFRYARNLANGIGLIWNPGETVEGYTNFLWTILISAGMRFGVEPVIFTQFLGMACFACSLFLTYRLAIGVGFPVPYALGALLLTGTNYTFSSYATGGLETQMVTALFLAGCVAAVRALTGKIKRQRGLLILTLLATIAILCRMDSALLLWATGLGLIGFSREQRYSGELTTQRGSPGSDCAILVLLPLILLAPWVVWKLSYYGDVLPHSFYLKAVNAASIERGLRYFTSFIVSYDLYPFLFICVFFFGKIFTRENRPLLLLAGVTTLWFGYILKIGGDFMEFRFMVQVIPLMMILLVWMLRTCAPKKWMQVAGIVLVLGGSAHHALTFSYVQETGVEPVGTLRNHLISAEENWIGIGIVLGGVFTPADSVVIATTAAGAIPYYSGLRTVDMLGINSPDAASRGVSVGYIPGHQRVLPYAYLNEKQVNLVISHPIVRPVGTPSLQLPLLPTDGPPHLNGKLIRVPVGGGYDVSILYIRQNAAVDSAIAKFGWPWRTVRF